MLIYFNKHIKLNINDSFSSKYFLSTLKYLMTKVTFLIKY